MEISVIIVNYKSKSKTARCLESVYASDWNNLSFETIVVENGSSDDLSEFKKYPNLQIINSSKNLGMGGGNNLGLKEARGKFILILNPDTVLKSTAIKILYDYLQNNSQALIAGPKLLYPDGILQYSCSNFTKFYTPLLRRTFIGRFFKKSLRKFLMLDFDHAQVRVVDWLMGSCLLIRRAGWGNGEFKGFDERYFMYFEDTDLGKQVAKLDKKVVYQPEAVVIHDHSRASADNPWYLAPFKDRLAREHIKSWFKYFAKWGIK